MPACLTSRRKEQERIANEKQAMLDKQRKAEAEPRPLPKPKPKPRPRPKKMRADALRLKLTRLPRKEPRREAQAAAGPGRRWPRAAARPNNRKLQAAAAEAIRQKEEQRQRLLNQLNQVLETKDTPSGLVVSMPDVLFDSGSYTLKPAARERLARISGIVLAYPDLRLEIEGHTDSVGSDAYNQTLSEKRAASVRDYLVDNGVSINNVIARGLGKGDPVADNSTAAGRQTESPGGDDRFRRRDWNPDHTGRDHNSGAEPATVGSYCRKGCHQARLSHVGRAPSPAVFDFDFDFSIRLIFN